jgi:modulator of FtsH protease
MAGWENFFIAEVGAAAALGGLLFVSISLNLTKILAIEGLPERAGQSLLLILAVLILASLMLMPNQPLALVGVEILVVSIVAFAFGTLYAVRAKRAAPAEYRGNFIWNIVGFEVAMIPCLIGGVTVLAGSSLGLYALAAGFCFSFIKATSEAWVLLVEINR